MSVRTTDPGRSGAAAPDRLAGQPPPAARTGALDRPSGLTSAEAAARLARLGPNVLAEEKGPSQVRRFAANFVHLFALLLWAGAILALFGGLPALSAAIVTVIFVNAVFAFVQEYRAERAVQALRQLLPVRVHVRRDGQVAEVASEEIVPGDALVLEPGDRIAADGNLFAVAGLRVDESTLTGEAYPTEPQGRVYAGTFVTGGSGEAEVTATGMETRFGRIAALTQRTRRDRSPLERELDRVTRLVAALSVTIGAAFFLVAGVLGMSLSDRFVFAIGVMVALVPEGLLPTVTLSLALATQRMARRHALVRRLSSVETLGETTVICTDKTGTLTENEMTVQRIWTPTAAAEIDGTGYEPFGRFRSGDEVLEPQRFAELLRAGLLCNDARLLHAKGGWSIVGDPTEGALVVLAEKGGLRHEQEAARSPRIGEIPFSSERKRMTTLHLSEGRRIAYTKGAAELVLPLTTLTAAERAAVEAQAHAMERDALRVLAVARRILPDQEAEPLDVERELEFLGLVGMIDPPRPEVPEAVRRCRLAGIRIVMVTGDSGRTAEAIARRIGLVEGSARVVTGGELARLGDDELRAHLAEPGAIFARIDPEQKLRLAHLLRRAGEVVAMTGDGVNDAPALKEADIGLAMGRSGTEVAKEAADMILLDDNFASVVAAVEEGRAVYDDIRRFAGYHFCSNVGELVPFLVWGITGGAVPLPLVVMQVLAIDLGTDMLPAIALGTERAEPGTMERPPRPRRERLLNAPVLGRVFGWIGPLEGLAAMASFLFACGLAGWRPWEAIPDSGTIYYEATAMTMAGIVMGQVGAGLGWRTNRGSIRSVGFISNRLLVVGIAVEVAMIFVLSYTPGLARIFHMSALGPWHWLFLLVWPPLVLGAEEARKAVVRARTSRCQVNGRKEWS
ncbi:MAG TPA: cation-transporting P-type ATPase [Gaiellaceae bacterium]|nr:cation-transporting P-type ATPase [Gaiellaceae bacterium]